MRLAPILLLAAACAMIECPAASADQCGKVKVKSGSSCESLEAVLDLAGCDEPMDTVPGKVVCEGDEAKVRHEGEAYLYQGYARRGADGAWNAVAGVDRYPKPGVTPRKAPSKGKVRGKSAVNPDARAPQPPVEAPPQPIAARAIEPSAPTPVAPKAADASFPSLLPPLPVAQATPPPPQKPEPVAASPWGFKAAARLRTETSDKTDLVSNRAFTLLRVRPQVSYTPAPYMTLVLAPQFARTFGEPVYNGTSTTLNALQETSGSTFDPALSVHEAYADLRPADWARFLVGRQILSYGDELVIGALEWNNVARSFDAGKARISYSLGWTDVFASKLQDNNTTATATVGDKDFYGIYNGWSFGPWLKDADLYLLWLRDATPRVSPAAPTTSLTQNLWTAGLRFKSSVGALDYRAEATKQWLTYAGVEGLQQEGTQADVELGYSLSSLPAKPRLALEAFYATKNYNQLFPTAHKWLGYADVLGRRNVSGAALHASAAILDNLKAAIDYHYFLRTDSTGTPFKINGATAIGTASGSGSKQVGNEIDLTLSYQATKLLGFTLGGSLFFSGDYIKDQFPGRETLDFYFAQMDIKL
jgi:hypothetical protein